MAAISLRRNKEKGLVDLPSKSIETFFVNLSDEEREVYDQMEGEAEKIVQGYISDGSLVVNYSTILGIPVRLRQMCTDLALCPSDLRALIPPGKIEDVKNNPRLLQKLLSVLQDGEDFDCPICISPPKYYNKMLRSHLLPILHLEDAQTNKTLLSIVPPSSFRVQSLQSPSGVFSGNSF